MIKTKIARYIEENGIKKNYVSGKIGMAPQSLTQVLKGRRVLDIEEYMKICNALGVSYDFFLLDECIGISSPQPPQNPPES